MVCQIPESYPDWALRRVLFCGTKLANESARGPHRCRCDGVTPVLSGGTIGRLQPRERLSLRTNVGSVNLLRPNAVLLLLSLRLHCPVGC